MKKELAFIGLLGALLLVPAVAFASISISSVKINGSSVAFVQPGDSVDVSVTAVLTDRSKWKGTSWGINNTGAKPVCVNTKNDKDRRSPDDGSYTQSFTITAPATPGLYSLYFKGDGKNNCGQQGPLYSLLNSLWVGNDISAPVIAAHSDIYIESFTAKTVTYSSPTASDDRDASVAVICTPASGTVFQLGNTVVTCNAQDSSGNLANPVSFTVSVMPPPDTQAPVFAPAANIAAVAADANGATVTYTTPTATDDRDGAVPVACVPGSGTLFAVGDTTVVCSTTDIASNTATSTFMVSVAFLPDTTAPILTLPDPLVVQAPAPGGVAVTYTASATDERDGALTPSCTPASGSAFPVGETTVTCTAADVAGNTAGGTFSVTVLPYIPQPFTMASQPDDSTLCPFWRDCYTNGASQRTIDLGQGSSMGAGSILSVTIARDESWQDVAAPWRISILCYTDTAHTQTCPNWIAPNSWNSGQTYLITEQATTTDDGKYWTAYFTNPARESNFGGSHPVVFNPAYYYDLVINDNFWEIGAYGSATEPYWVLTGLQ